MTLRVDKFLSHATIILLNVRKNKSHVYIICIILSTVDLPVFYLASRMQEYVNTRGLMFVLRTERLRSATCKSTCTFLTRTRFNFVFERS